MTDYGQKIKEVNFFSTVNIADAYDGWWLKSVRKNSVMALIFYVVIMLFVTCNLLRYK